MYRYLIVALSLVLSINVNANVKADEAAAAYAERDFNEAGVKKAELAARLYAEAVSVETDQLTKLTLMRDQATAYYFLGTAKKDKDVRMAQHQKAIELSDAILVELGVDPKTAHEMNQDQVTDILNKYDENFEYVVADAMYSKGVNLGQWGRLKGISSSIGRLPIVLGLMERVEMMGYESMHEYGPYRTIGRINFILPKLLGGDLKKSEQYLKDAFRKSLAEGQKYSLNGYNNIYFAETLYKLGKENQAKRVIDLFLAADPLTLKENYGPENRDTIRQAEKLRDDWQ